MAKDDDEDENKYEHLSLIINEFEKAALLSEKREGAMVVAHGPLTAMDAMLESSDAVLAKVDTFRGGAQGTAPTETEQIEGFFKGEGDPIHLMQFDADINDLFINEKGKNPVGDYIKKCLGCDLRLQFDWQLKPINLLGGIQGLLDGINNILDAFKLQLTPPKKLLAQLCELLNILQKFCLPDVLSMLLALKMLLKRYISDAISIQLDWTVVLGPLLKFIVEAIASLLENIGAVILAPLDCAISALTAAGEIENAARELAGQVSIFAQSTAEQVKALGQGNLFPGAELYGMAEDYRWHGSTIGESKYPEAPEFGGAYAQGRAKDLTSMFHLNMNGGNTSGSSGGLLGNSSGNTFLTVPTGFKLTRDTKLQDAIKDPKFADASFIDQFLLPVIDARDYIQDLLDNLIKSISSVQVLTSGGLAVQMGNIGLIMFISDVYSLGRMIFKILKDGIDVDDFCSHLEDHPYLVENGIRENFRSLGDVRVTSDKERHVLLLQKGPDTIGEIKTCISGRSETDNHMLDQWIKDLQRKGAKQ